MSRLSITRPITGCCILAMERIAGQSRARPRVGERPVHRLDDVAAFAELPQRRLQLVGDGPDAGLGLLWRARIARASAPPDAERAVEVGADLTRLGPKVEHASGASEIIARSMRVKRSAVISACSFSRSSRSVSGPNSRVARSWPAGARRR